MDPKNGVDGLKPRGFFLRKFHYERLEIENETAGLGDARSIRWAVNGLLAGIAIAVMPFIDWPPDSETPRFGVSLSISGIASLAAGLLLAGFSLFMMVRRARIKGAQDSAFIGCDGDPAP